MDRENGFDQERETEEKEEEEEEEEEVYSGQETLIINLNESEFLDSSSFHSTEQENEEAFSLIELENINFNRFTYDSLVCADLEPSKSFLDNEFFCCHSSSMSPASNTSDDDDEDDGQFNSNRFKRRRSSANDDEDYEEAHVDVERLDNDKQCKNGFQFSDLTNRCGKKRLRSALNTGNDELNSKKLNIVT